MVKGNSLQHKSMVNTSSVIKERKKERKKEIINDIDDETDTDVHYYCIYV